MRSYFYEHKGQYHSNEFPIFTDGSKSDEGVGCAATSYGGYRKMKLMTQSSIFTAELCGLFCGLQIANSMEHERFVIYCDSTSAIKVTDHFESTHPIIRKIIILLIKLKNRNKNISFCWSPAHVGIAGSEAADKLAASAARENTPPYNDELPYRDWYPLIREGVKDLWAAQWQRVDHNKLRQLKDTIVPWQPLNNRKQSIILTRLRIGHTKLTHQYLMEQQHQPYCEDCIVYLTVKHLLAECPSHSDLRLQLYPESQNLSPEDTMRLMLAERQEEYFNPDRILRYLRELGAYSHI